MFGLVMPSRVLAQKWSAFSRKLWLIIHSQESKRLTWKGFYQSEIHLRNVNFLFLTIAKLWWQRYFVTYNNADNLVKSRIVIWWYNDLNCLWIFQECYKMVVIMLDNKYYKTIPAWLRSNLYLWLTHAQYQKRKTDAANQTQVSVLTQQQRCDCKIKYSHSEMCIGLSTSIRIIDL